MIFKLTVLAGAISFAVATPIWSPRATNSSKNCACGYKDDQGNLWREGFESDFKTDHDGAFTNFAKMQWGKEDNGYWRQNQLQNLYQIDGGLAMKVPAYDGSGTIYNAEIQSFKTDLQYGSFRVQAAIPSVEGTCMGMFTFTSATQEIDIELLSIERNKAWYINQPSHTANSYVHTHAQVTADVSSAPDFTQSHEHRLDWTPSSSKFFFDSEQQAEVTVNIPTDPTSFTVNHWSNGHPTWSQGPPTSDAIVTVAYINAYFNTSSFSEEDFTLQCNQAQVSVCEV